MTNPQNPNQGQNFKTNAPEGFLAKEAKKTLKPGNKKASNFEEDDTALDASSDDAEENDDESSSDTSADGDNAEDDV